MASLSGKLSYTRVTNFSLFICLFWAALKIYACYPGFMGGDPSASMANAMSGTYQNWHPPLYAWILGSLYDLGFYPISCLSIFSITAFAYCTWDIIAFLGKRYSCSWIFLIILYLINIEVGTLYGKDELLYAFLLLALSIYLRLRESADWSTPRKLICTSLFLIALFFATSMRHTIVFVTIPWCFLTINTVYPFRKRYRYSLGVAVSFLLAAGTIIIVPGILHTQDIHPAAPQMVRDIISIQRIQQRQAPLFEGFHPKDNPNLADLDNLLSNDRKARFRSNPDDLCIIGLQSICPLTDKQYEHLKKTWIDTILQSPGTFLACRTVFSLQTLCCTDEIIPILKTAKILTGNAEWTKGSQNANTSKRNIAAILLVALLCSTIIIITIRTRKTIPWWGIMAAVAFVTLYACHLLYEQKLIIPWGQKINFHILPLLILSIGAVVTARKTDSNTRNLCLTLLILSLLTIAPYILIPNFACARYLTPVVIFSLIAIIIRWSPQRKITTTAPDRTPIWLVGLYLLSIAAIILHSQQWKTWEGSTELSPSPYTRICISGDKLQIHDEPHGRYGYHGLNRVPTDPYSTFDITWLNGRHTAATRQEQLSPTSPRSWARGNYQHYSIETNINPPEHDTILIERKSATITHRRLFSYTSTIKSEYDWNSPWEKVCAINHPLDVSCKISRLRILPSPWQQNQYLVRLELEVDRNAFSPAKNYSYILRLQDSHQQTAELHLQRAVDNDPKLIREARPGHLPLSGILTVPANWNSLDRAELEIRHQDGTYEQTIPLQLQLPEPFVTSEP